MIKRLICLLLGCDDTGQTVYVRDNPRFDLYIKSYVCKRCGKISKIIAGTGS